MSSTRNSSSTCTRPAAREPFDHLIPRPNCADFYGVRREADGFESHQAQPTGRPWLGVRFTCSGAYVRVYRHVDGSSYLARCPRCGRSVRFRVSPGGINERFFEVRC
jgi:hypothetical protein